MPQIGDIVVIEQFNDESQSKYPVFAESKLC
jgi:hypothetical protein